MNARQLASYSDTAKHDMECWDALMKVVFPFLLHAAAAFGLCNSLPTDFAPNMDMVKIVKSILNIDEVKPKLQWLAGAQETDDFIKAVQEVDGVLAKLAGR